MNSEEELSILRDDQIKILNKINEIAIQEDFEEIGHITFARESVDLMIESILKNGMGWYIQWSSGCL